jgi:dienelactone hydrolase
MLQHTAPKCFVNLAGVYVTNEHPDAYQCQLAADRIVHLRRESSVRVLTIHGYEDEAVPVQDAFRYDKEIANHNLYVIKKANHTFNGLRFLDEMVFKIFNHYNSVRNKK